MRSIRESQSASLCRSRGSRKRMRGLPAIPPAHRKAYRANYTNRWQWKSDSEIWKHWSMARLTAAERKSITVTLDNAVDHGAQNRGAWYRKELFCRWRI